MKGYKKYAKQYFLPTNVTMDWVKKDAVDKPPIWCSVDLRDGNQALIVPMNLEEKLKFFAMLCKIGFKEIEIGFPASNETEYEFCRALIERDLIPDDVTVQVLTQAREHIINKTFKALEGAKKAIVHLYNSTSLAQREQVFKKSKREIVEIAKKGATLCKNLKDCATGQITLEYSPESFTGTEPEFAVEICNEVLEIWQPTPTDKAIINLPVTVSYSMPHIYANQVEFMSKNLLYRENVVLSLHPHNDRGCAVADTEMGLLAGAERVEGTLFGNGERAGNVDLVVLALNMYSHGVDPKLNFSSLPKIVKTYEKVTRMRVNDRQPYSGRLAFAAFAGSHQDAIAKSIKYRAEKSWHWNVPYLPIDPADIGRDYETDVIRINSQSGKGGIGYILETQFKFDLPTKMREVFGYYIKNISDREHRELTPEEIRDIFMSDFTNVETPLDVCQTSFGSTDGGQVEGEVEVSLRGTTQIYAVEGIGGLNCVCKAIKLATGLDFALESYFEHAVDERSTSKAASYVSISIDEKIYWGAGLDSDIFLSSVKALVSAVNALLSDQNENTR